VIKLIRILFLSLLSSYSPLLFAETTYCYGELCSLDSSPAEEAMKSATEHILADELIYNNTTGQDYKKLRHYVVPEIKAHYLSSELFENLPDYAASGSPECQKSLGITKSPWVFAKWLSTGDKTMAQEYERSVIVKVRYGLYDPIEGCTYKNPIFTHLHHKHRHHICEVGYDVMEPGFGGGEFDLPRCISTLTSFLNEYQCDYPFALDEEKLCVTYCPPSAPTLDKDYGVCRPYPDQLDRPECAELVLNPIDASKGDKLHNFDPDFKQNDIFPLSFQRNYRSSNSPEAKRQRYKQGGQPDPRWKKYIQSPGYTGPKYDLVSAVESPNPKTGFKQWRHNYQFSLFEAEDKEVTISLSSGKYRRFNSVAGIYDADGELGDQLIKESDHWHYYGLDKLTYIFNAHGQLTQILSPSGDTQSLSYNHAGLLQTISHSNGDSLSLVYKDDVLTQVVAPNGQVYLYQYDKFNNLVKVIYPDDTPNDISDNPTEQYHYENETFTTFLTGITDANNVRYASWQYDATGRAIASEHAGGVNAGTLEYSTDGERVTITNVRGKQKILDYNRNNRLSKTTGESCDTSGEDGEKSYAYDHNGRVIDTVDETGSNIHYSYNDQGLIASKIEASYDAEAQTTSYTYHDTYAKPTQIIHPNGLIENFNYGQNGRLEKHTLTADGESRSTTYGYNSDGLLSAIAGSRVDVEDITSFTYLDGRLASVTNALGQTMSFEDYDGFGNATKITDANGVVSYLSYDVRGRLTQIDHDGRISKFDYDAIGQLIKTIEPSGRYLEYHYDKARRLTQVSNNLGQSLNYTLDAQGNVTQQQVIGADNNIHFSLQFVYDQVDRLSQTISATDQVWQNEYDVAGNLVKQITPANTELKRTFDKLRRFTQQQDQAENNTDYQYNKLNQLTQVTDALGRTTSYKYNNFGERISQTSPDTGISTFTYDLAGNLITQTDARGVVTTYSYDALNRVTSMSYSDSTDNNTVFTYDSPDQGRYAIGRLARVEKAFNSTEYFYNQYGELVKEVVQLDRQAEAPNTVQSYTVRYSYNEDGQISRLNYPGGRALNYSYDALGRIQELYSTLGASGSKQVFVSDIQYLAFGDITQLIYGNGKVLTNSYNQNYQLTAKTTDHLLDKTYVYDAVNNIQSITDNLDTQHSEQFSYNSVHWLTQAKGTYGDYSFSYDAIGNRLNKQENNQSTNYVYLDNSQLSSISGTTPLAMTYDARGNLLSRGGDSFTYDSQGRLSSTTVDGETTQYRYNARGQRIAKIFADGDIRYYAYDANGLLLAELNNQARTQVEYIYLGGRRIAMMASFQPYYMHTNHLDAPVAISDRNGELVWQASYSPFGDMSILQDSLTPSVSARFPGQYADTETGFYYNYFRDYDPELGRYIQSDPIGLTGGINTYSYASQNPVSHVDPHGLLDLFIGGAGDGGILHNNVQMYHQYYRETYPERNSTFFTHDDRSGIYEAIDKALNNCEKINIVGHSWGGHAATRVTSEALRRGRDISLLITIDPVSLAGSIYIPPHKTFWLNVNSEPSDRNYSILSNGVIVTLGGKWGHNNSALVSWDTDASHGDFGRMMHTNGPLMDGVYSPLWLLTNSPQYQKDCVCSQ